MQNKVSDPICVTALQKWVVISKKAGVSVTSSYLLYHKTQSLIKTNNAFDQEMTMGTYWKP